MASDRQSGDYAGTPVGYYRLGRSAPRTQVRQYDLRRRRLFIPQTVEEASSLPYGDGPALYAGPGGRYGGVRRIELNHDSPFAKGLVGWWAMGNRASWGSNKLHDLSPYGNHGPLTGMDPTAAWRDDGQVFGLSFDGVDDYARPDIRGILNGASAVTVSVRFKTTSNSATQGFLSSYNGWLGSDAMHLSVQLEPSATIRYSVRPRDGQSMAGTAVFSAAADGSWHHLIASTDSIKKSMTVCVDGQFLTVTIVDSDMVVPLGDFFYSPLIGARNNAGVVDNFFAGQLDDVRVYRRAFTDKEIEALYVETKDGSYGSLEKRPTRIFFLPKVEEPQPFSIVRAPTTKQPAIRPIELNLDSPFAQGLVGWWPAGASQHWGSTQLRDFSRYSNVGALTGISVPSAWKYDGYRSYIEMDGVNDHVVIPKSNGSLKITANVSISLWFWSTGLIDGDDGGLFSGNGRYFGTAAQKSYELGVLNNTLYWQVSDGSSDSRVSFSFIPYLDGAWHHIVATYAPSTYQAVYIDGVLIDSNLAPRASIQDLGANASIGDAGGSWNPSARFDDVRVFDVTLSDASVSQLHEETKDGSYGSLEKKPRAVFFFEQDTSVKPFFVRTQRKTSAVRRIEFNYDSPFARGLVGWWPMGNKASWGSKKLYDASIYGNHGTLQSMDPTTDWVHDGERSGLAFDGANDYTAIPVGYDPTGNFTFSLWCLVPSGDTLAAVIGGTPDRVINIYPGKDPIGLSVGWKSWDFDTTTASRVLNEWLHIAVTVSSTAINAFVHGVNHFSATRTTSPSSWTAIDVGRRASGLGPYYLNCKVDDVRIYNRALTAKEVARLHDETRDGSYGSLELPERKLVYFPETAPAPAPLARRQRRRLSYPHRSRFPSWL